MSTIPEHFSLWVEKTPEAVAVVYKNIQLTYRELDRRANLLAQRLLVLRAAP